MSDEPQRDWTTVHIWDVQPVRDVLVVLAVIGVLYLGALASVVTVPLLLAVLLAYLLEPLTRWLIRRRGFTRRRAVIGILVAFVALVILPLFAGVGIGVAQGVDLVKRLGENAAVLRASIEDPDNADKLEAVPEGAWRSLRDYLLDLGDTADAITSAPREQAAGEQADQPAADGEDDGATRRSAAQIALAWIENNAQAIARQVVSTGAGAVTAAVATLGAIVSLAFAAFLTVFFYYFVATGWPRVLAAGRAMVPVGRRRRVVSLVRQMDGVVSGFVRGRLIIGVILGVFFSVGWWAVGVPAPLLIGMATGVLAIVPYAATVGLPVAILLLWLENTGDFRDAWWWALLAPTLVYQAGQIADDYLLTPKIQGRETDMDIPSILFATLAGGALLGVYGLLVAIPLAACIKILLREILWPRYRAWVRGEQRDFLPLSGDAT